jgi:pectinesterase inhibitor-like protein
VRATCNSTTYPDLCVSTLSADPSSATADVRGLSAIAVSAAAANASGGAATATALADSVVNATAAAQAPTTAGDDDATVQALLRTCAAKYGEARNALAAARGSIAAQDYDSASVHVSAAAEYPQVCRVLFQRQRPGAYPAELAAREVALRQLCTVALDIVTILSNNSN